MLVTADTQTSLVTAVDLIKRLLVPVPDSRNEHKRVQLEELARINGNRDQTWVDDSDRFDWNLTAVQCSLCAGLGHVTADCLMRGRDRLNQRLESEFDAFLSEIGEAPPPSQLETCVQTPPAAVQPDHDLTDAEFWKHFGDLLVAVASRPRYEEA